MGKKRESGTVDALERLICAADADVLRKLVRRLADKPDIRRACLEFLRKKVPIEAVPIADTDAEIILALWDNLQPDLDELEEYCGGDYDAIDHVGEQLYILNKRLDNVTIPVGARRDVLNKVMRYIHSRSSGLEDALYDVAYALCKDTDDWRDLAARLEATGQDWPCDHARRIYRRIGDRDKYLELRWRRMEYGADYHDLATFHWESGETEQAMAVAREGLEKAAGRMDELRGFLSERAKASGDHASYLELEFAQATNWLSLDRYKKFKKLCSNAEWREYESRILEAISKASSETRVQIHLYRKDFSAATEVLATLKYPGANALGSDVLLKAAAELETVFPERVLAFYLTGLGNLNFNETRKHYAHYAQAIKRARRVWIDVLRKPEEWKAYAKRIKLANARRRAFQEEFAKVIRGWDEL